MADALGDRSGSNLRSRVSPIRRHEGHILLATAIFVTLMRLLTLALGTPHTISAQVSLTLCAIACWLAFAWRKRRAATALLVVVGLAALGSIIPEVALRPGSYTLVSIAVVLLWTGFLLPPRVNVVLGALSMVGLWAAGADFSPTSTGLEVAGNIAVPTMISLIFVSLLIGSAMHYRDRAARERVELEIRRLEQESRRLAYELEDKVAELEMSREQLIQAQKLKTVGTMASGLAHELNNILTPIRGLAELIAQGTTTEQSSRYGQRILDSAIAAAQITGALLTYTRQGTFQPVRSNAAQLLQGQILPVLSNSLPRGIQLHVDLERNVSIDVDRLLFQQCVTNLVLNAVDAMPEGGEITIRLTTSPRSCGDDDPPAAASYPGTPRSAVLTVIDTGSGIAPEHLDQIFDPFFTTKVVGSGTGLGLAMVQGTVSRHGGKVLVDSTPGRGSKFTLMLPLAPSDERSAASSWPVLRGEHVRPAVLVVTEDQDSLDEFEELLEVTECSPICCSDPRAAGTLVTEMGEKLDLLILDWQLREMDPARLLRTVRQQFPHMPVIVVSDEPTDPSVQRAVGTGPTRSVRKPVDPQLFATLMTDLLLPATGYVRDFTPVPISRTSLTDSGPHPRARSGT